MGCVYEVYHVTLGRRYALKVLHAEVLERDPRSIDRFVREARAASRIHHANIVDVFDFGYLADGRPYFVMELLEGTSLGDVIDNDGAIEPVRALGIARELVDALRAAHESGVIHADVTPSNILVAGDHVKLVDFGLAELLADLEIDESATHIMGTPRYVAPERLQGRLASEACDQYSLGIVLFEMIAGVTPFHYPDMRTLCRQHIHEPLPPLLSPFTPIPEEARAVRSRAAARNRRRSASRRCARSPPSSKPSRGSSNKELAVLHPDDALEPPAVIIVDDDEGVVAAAARTLRPSQLTVLATTEIDQVLEWLRTRDIAVLVTDFQMPRMNGLELISIARQDQPSTVRILMTGQNALETAIEAINRGEIFRYVPKPFDGAKFRAVVTDALGRHRELRDRARRARRGRPPRALLRERRDFTHPGICAVERDDDGCYIVPEVCNAVATRLLGFDGRTP